MTSPPSPPSPASKTVCSFCGQDNDPAARFCGDCGKPLSASAARVQPAYSVGGVVASTMPVDQSAALAGGATRKQCRKCGADYDKSEDFFCRKCGTRVGDRVSLVTKAVGSGPSLAIGIQQSGPRIAILDERGEPSKVFTLDTGEAVIGRGDADIRFEYDIFLSPLHARVDLREGVLWLRDLGSRNGSWVFIDEPTKLVDGDLILVGSQMLRFRRLGYPGPHPPEADSTRRMGSVTPPVDVAILEQLRADGSVRDLFHLSPGRNALLGRETGDWIFPYDQTMSGKHAEIVSEDIEFFVHDAGSRNGVAMAVRGDRELKKGQRFLMGDQILRVENV
jgi:pSer/pThr/pTyr-binding forkhead associated (FHA) protein